MPPNYSLLQECRRIFDIRPIELREYQGYKSISAIIIIRWMQDIVGRVWVSGMHYSQWRGNEAPKVAESQWGDNSCRNFVVAHCWLQSSWAYSVNYHVSITSVLPSWSRLLLFGFGFCTFDTFSPYLTHFFWHWAMPPSTSHKLYQYDVRCNFHMLRVIFHE